MTSSWIRSASSHGLRAACEQETSVETAYRSDRLLVETAYRSGRPPVETAYRSGRPPVETAYLLGTSGRDRLSIGKPPIETAYLSVSLRSRPPIGRTNLERRRNSDGMFRTTPAAAHKRNGTSRRRGSIRAPRARGAVGRGREALGLGRALVLGQAFDAAEAGAAVPRALGRARTADLLPGPQRLLGFSERALAKTTVRDAVDLLAVLGPRRALAGPVAVHDAPALPALGLGPAAAAVRACGRPRRGGERRFG